METLPHDIDVGCSEASKTMRNAKGFVEDNVFEIEDAIGIETDPWKAHAMGEIVEIATRCPIAIAANAGA